MDRLWRLVGAAVGIVGVIGLTGALMIDARKDAARAVAEYPPWRLHPDDPTLVEEGRALYAVNCAACHGANLQGQPNWRTRRADGRLPAPPHDATGHTWHHPDAQLFEVTARGVAALVGQGYESDMPAYGDILTDREIVAVLSYIKSTWPAEILQRRAAINAAYEGRPES